MKIVSINNYNLYGSHKNKLQNKNKAICVFSGNNTNFSDDLIPTPNEIKGIIKHLPQSEKEAEITAKKDVKTLILQLQDLMETENIKTAEEYKNYMGDYVILGKKVFEKLSPEQKSKSIMLQQKSIEEMNNQILNLELKPEKNIIKILLKTQIEMSTETLAYCKANARAL